MNADPAELEKFSQLASRWWDPHGESRPLHEINPLRLDWIDQRAPLAGKRVLDVGGGGGILAEAWAARGAGATAIALSEKSLRVAELHSLQSRVQVDYEHVTAEEYAARHAGQFDLVTCMELLEHVPEPAAMVAACARLVRPGGQVFFSTINRNPKSYLFAVIGAQYVLRLLPRGTHDYLRFIKPSELSRWARDAGLHSAELIGMTYNPLSRRYRLERDCDVNYLLRCVRGEQATRARCAVRFRRHVGRHRARPRGCGQRHARAAQHGAPRARDGASLRLHGCARPAAHRLRHDAGARGLPRDARRIPRALRASAVRAHAPLPRHGRAGGGAWCARHRVGRRHQQSHTLDLAAVAGSGRVARLRGLRRLDAASQAASGAAFARGRTPGAPTARLPLCRRRPARHPGGARRGHALRGGRIRLPRHRQSGPRRLERQCRHLASFATPGASMKAVAHTGTDIASLVDIELPTPSPTGRDLPVKVEAVSVNPVDTKQRKTAHPAPRVLGWDAAGTVAAVGPQVTLFKPGDAVYYAGDVTRPGCNSEFHLVDERIVGRKPKSKDFAQAAAIPLPAITPGGRF